MNASLTLIASLFLNQYRDVLITYVTCPTSKAGMGEHLQLLAALLCQPRRFWPGLGPNSVAVYTAKTFLKQWPRVALPFLASIPLTGFGVPPQTLSNGNCFITHRKYNQLMDRSLTDLLFSPRHFFQSLAPATACQLMHAHGYPKQRHM